MPSVFWTGRLSLPMMLIANMNNILAWITGNARDTAAMKQRMKLGYEGACSDHVTRYDELGLEHYTKIATKLFEVINLRGKEVLDVGCGTGILSLLALKQGAAKVVSSDLSEYMLAQCRKKAIVQGYNGDRVNFRQLDAESLPYEGNRFDAVVSGMVIGLVPNQQKVVNEMARVLRSGGDIAFSTHAPDCFWEAADATFRAIPKRYVLGYRIEYWPCDETKIRRMLIHAGFVDVRTRRLTWQDNFENGGEAYDFFSAVSSSWWYSKLPKDKIEKVSNATRNYFKRKRITQITHDIIMAYGRRP